MVTQRCRLHERGQRLQASSHHCCKQSWSTWLGFAAFGCLWLRSSGFGGSCSRWSTGSSELCKWSHRRGLMQGKWARTAGSLPAWVWAALENLLQFPQRNSNIASMKSPAIQTLHLTYIYFLGWDDYQKKMSINIFKLFNILTSERKFLKVSQKLLCGSRGSDIWLYCYHFGLVLEMVKGT